MIYKYSALFFFATQIFSVFNLCAFITLCTKQTIKTKGSTASGSYLIYELYKQSLRMNMPSIACCQLFLTKNLFVYSVRKLYYYTFWRIARVKCLIDNLYT